MDLTSVIAYPWVVPVVCGSTIAIVAGSISDCVKRVSQTNLKQSMVEQGYSVEQIQYVLAAKPGDKPVHGSPPPKRQKDSAMAW